MRTLLLLRHAKASWKHPGTSDHDRPLSARGKRDAPRVGRLLRDESLAPGVILTSTATRAVQTAEEVAPWIAVDPPDRIVQREPELYLASAETVLDVVRHAGEESPCVLVVGHNPGLEELGAFLTRSDAARGLAIESFPTAALAQIELPISVWTDLRWGATGRLVSFWRPKDLDE